MSRLSLAGAGALIAGPVVAAVAALVATTESDDPATRVAAYTNHHGAMAAGLALEVVSIVLIIAGIAWLALALAPRSRNLAAAGGIVAFAGSLAILFEDGLTAAQSPVVSGLGQGQAAAVVDRIHSSTASSLDPLAILLAVGTLLLAVAAVKVGAPRLGAAAFALGMIVNTIGFGAGSQALIVAGFAVFLAGVIPLVRTLTGREPAQLAAAQLASS